MRILIILALLNGLLFSVEGIVIFNDGTTIDGDISNVDKSTVYIIPDGLTFPEEIRMENVDSLKLNDGKLLVANGTVILYYSNGSFIEPGANTDKKTPGFEDYDVEYVIIPNWSLNLYTGYPLIKGNTFSFYDQLSPVFGLSIGSPYGLFFGDFFMNVISEVVYYKFRDSNKGEDAEGDFEGLGLQIGVSPGLFIGDATVSLTACTGLYHAGPGIIAGGSVDIPIGSIILKKYGNLNFIKNNSELIESIELRLTSRANAVNKEEDGWTGWIGGGFSLGYEF